MIGFRCECGPAIDCTYPKCNEGVEVSSKDITERLLDYARDYTTTTYHDDLIREAVTEIESLRQQLTEQSESLEFWMGQDLTKHAEIVVLKQQLAESKEELSRARLQNAIVYGTSHPEIYKTKEDELREHILSAHVHLSYRQGTWHSVPMEYADKAQSQLEQALAVMEPKEK